MACEGAGVAVEVVGLDVDRESAVLAGVDAAVEAISEALHFELGLTGIRVHVVQPVQFPTGLGANTVTAAAFTPAADGYWEIAEAVESRAKALVPSEEQPDPKAVARTIADLVEDPEAPLRTSVGGDAELITGARHGRCFEEYEVLMRGVLDLWEGYRRDRQ